MRLEFALKGWGRVTRWDVRGVDGKGGMKGRGEGGGDW